MNKTIKRLTAAALLLGLCVTAAACGCTQKPVESMSEATTLPVDTTQTPSVPDSQTTAPTESDSGTPATKPNLDVGFGVGTGRVEADGGQQSTKPADDQPAATTPQTGSGLNLTYEEYMRLSGSQQQELFDKYFADDPTAFAAWFAKIKAEYDDQRQEVEATGPIDLEDYLNP